jgi:hypothetical protein
LGHFWPSRSLSVDPLCVSPNPNAVRLVWLRCPAWCRRTRCCLHWWVNLVHTWLINNRRRSCWYRRRSRPRLDPRTRRSRRYWRPVMRRPGTRRLRMRHLVSVVNLGSLLLGLNLGLGSLRFLGLWRLRLGSRGRRWCCSRPGVRSRRSYWRCFGRSGSCHPHYLWRRLLLRSR